MKCPPGLRVESISQALHHLRSARAILRLVSCRQSHGATCRAIKSAEGAQRHALRLASKPATAPTFAGEPVALTSTGRACLNPRQMQKHLANLKLPRP